METGRDVCFYDGKTITDIKTKEGNDVYLEHIRTDETLGEAYRLLLDWQEK